MVGFWICVALALAVAYTFFVPALRGKSRSAAVDRQKLNLILHQQRREELSRETDGGDNLATLNDELDKDLLSDLTATTQTTNSRPANQGRIPLLAALIAAPLAAFFAYSHLGRFDLANFAAEPRPEAAENAPAGKDMLASIDTLSERLKKDPNNLDGWLLLGRSLLATGQHDKAMQAYEFALKLAPDNLDVQALYAQALTETNGGNMTGKPEEIIAGILKKDPKHMTGLWLAGLAAAESGNATQAVAHWEKLKTQFPADSDDAKQLDKYIAKVQGKPLPVDSGSSPAKPADAKATAKTEKTGGKSFRVKVSLNDGFKAKANASDTVFIFARAASGPPMPLAIVRKQVKDLPIEVTLDDSMSMMQGMNLSSFEQLVIGARISKSGQALPSPGDLQGMSSPTSAENGKTYAIEIGQEVQ